MATIPQVEPVATPVTVSTLAQLRDELKLQIHLAKAEVKTEWERYETQWRELERKLAVVETASAEAAREVGQAIQLLMEEIAHGYERIRRTL
jgi:hypothetical protein